VLIYALLDPRNLKIRYIGKTKQPLKRRLYGHIATAKDLSNSYPVVHWIRKLATMGLQPSIHLLEVANTDNWMKRERYWIAYGHKQKWKLLNATSGGETTSGVVMTPETLAKFSERSRGEGNPKAKVTEADVYAIREEYAQGQTTTEILALQYGISDSTVQMIVRGQTWKHVGGTIVPKGFNPHYNLTPDDVIAIRQLVADGVDTLVIAAQFGIERGMIYSIASGKAWSHVGGVTRQPKENARGENNPKAKLTWADVRNIRTRYVNGGVSYTVLAQEYNITKPLVGMIIRGEIWQENDDTQQ
jgi:hypothetical protein